MQNQITISQKRNWPIILSTVFALLSTAYCSLSAYASWSGNEGIYAIRMVGTELAEATIKSLMFPITWVGLAAFIILWIVLMAYSWNVWDMRIIILLGVFTSIFTAIGFILGTLNSLSTVDSTYMNEKSYYLSYYYNASDNGFYDLVECKNWGIVCNQIWIDENGYSEIDKQAHLETNENTHKLSIVIEHKTVYTQPLD